MRKTLLLVLISFLAQASFAQKVLSPYQIYNAKGKKVSYKKMIKELNTKDIILIGEFHNNAIAHWLEYEITAAMDKENDLILGAEMMEADNQTQLNDYISGDIDQDALDTLARLWPNYKTDYKPLIDYAKENNLAFIATNIPRRFANQVYKQGWDALDALSEQEKKWVAPLPIAFDAELPQYKAILEMMGEHGSPELVMAQASKDATMAHFILNNYRQGYQFIHYNGAFHSDFHEGILWYLQLQRPELNYGTISTVSQENINQLDKEHIGRADFIICVDEDMTNTY